MTDRSIQPGGGETDARSVGDPERHRVISHTPHGSGKTRLRVLSHLTLEYSIPLMKLLNRKAAEYRRDGLPDQATVGFLYVEDNEIVDAEWKDTPEPLVQATDGGSPVPQDTEADRSGGGGR